MDALTDQLLKLLPEVGPGLLFLLAALETCFLTGLVVPAGIALLVASALAAAGTLPLLPVVGLSIAGALVGDSLGFWLGRRSSRVLLSSERAIQGLTAGRRRRIERILSGHPFVSVTLARSVAFVRTLMPLAAGASSLPYGRFLLFDLFGVGLWATLYAGSGWLAGEQSRAPTGILGLAVGAVFAIGVARLWLRKRGEARPGLLSVALTGNVAAGKSTVAEIWRQQGVPLISADVLAREAAARGSEGLEAIAREFGAEALTPGGDLDRAWMRRRVFVDPGARSRLEAILHPRIQRLRGLWMDDQRRRRARLVVAEIPLLFETGTADDFDRVVLVDASVESRRARLIEERGLEPEVADALMASQMDPVLKRASCDYVIENDGDLASLQARALEVLAALRRTDDG